MAVIAGILMLLFVGIFYWLLDAMTKLEEHDLCILWVIALAIFLFN